MKALVTLLVVLVSLVLPGTASAFRPIGAGTCTGGLDVAGSTAVGVLGLVGSQKHRGNVYDYGETASGSSNAARAGATAAREALGGLQAGRSAGVKVVNSAGELESLFGRLSSGGKVVEGSSYPGKLVQLGDETTVGLRAASKTGGPAIDIKLPGGELWKVHVQ